jgi:dihydroflavonol-4-reductase
MKRALVTGGCGFLGSFIVRELVGAGVSVRVLAVPGESRENLAGLGPDVEVVEGDVLRVPDVTRAVRGVDTVFHAAAIYADYMPDPTRMYDVNLGGTFHVLEAARREGVERVVATASIVALGRPEPGRLADEGTPYEAWDVDFPYSRSKYHARRLAEHFAEWGLDVRIVCPGIVLGPGDLRPTPSGQLVVNAFLPGPAIWFDGGSTFVDVRDAARVHLLAAERGRAGERYLATAHNLDGLAFRQAIDRAIGKKRRYLKLPLPVARAAAIAGESIAERTAKPPLLARDLFEFALKANFFDNAKSIRELGATYRPIEETLRDAIAYFEERGLIRRRGSGVSPMPPG